MRSVLDALDALGERLRQVQLALIEIRRAINRRPCCSDSHLACITSSTRSCSAHRHGHRRRRPWHLRPIVDARILSAWLIHRNDPEVFAAYRERGLGRLKLLRAHIETDLGLDAGVAIFSAVLTRRIGPVAYDAPSLRIKSDGSIGTSRAQAAPWVRPAAIGVRYTAGL
jgi:hypothetical protein